LGRCVALKDQRVLPGRSSAGNARSQAISSNSTYGGSSLHDQEPGPGYCHFPADYDDEFFLQLTAEKCVTRFHKGFPRREYIKTRPRNDALDCRVYAMAAFAILNMNINRLADRMAQQKTEPEAGEPMSVAEMQRAPAKRGRGGGGNWATGWR